MYKYILCKDDLKESQDYTRNRMRASGSSEEEINEYFRSQMRDPKYGMGFSHDFPVLTSDEQKELSDLESKEDNLDARLFLTEQKIADLNEKKNRLLEESQKIRKKICKIQGHRMRNKLYSDGDSFMPGYTYRECDVCGKRVYGMEVEQKDCVVRVLKNGPTIQS